MRPALSKRLKPDSAGRHSETTTHGFRHEPDNATSLEQVPRTIKNDSDRSSSREFRSTIQNDENEVGLSNKVHRFESGLMTFPEKLMMLLDGNCAKEAMWWLPDGDAFCFIPNVFAEQVLDKHFQGTKFESFTRKLNRWYVKLIQFFSTALKTFFEHLSENNLFSEGGLSVWQGRRFLPMQLLITTIHLQGAGLT